MSTFKNTSGVDRELQIDGRRFNVPDGETFTIADAFDDSLIEQPFFALEGKTKTAPNKTEPEPVVEPVEIEGDN